MINERKNDCLYVCYDKQMAHYLIPNKEKMVIINIEDLKTFIVKKDYKKIRNILTHCIFITNKQDNINFYFPFIANIYMNISQKKYIKNLATKTDTPVYIGYSFDDLYDMLEYFMEQKDNFADLYPDSYEAIDCWLETQKYLFRGEEK